MKWKRIWLPVLAIALTMVLLGAWKNSKVGVFWNVRRNLDKLEAHAENLMEHPQYDATYKRWNTGYSPGYGVVKFQISYLGFGSQSDEKGFYYAPDGSPRSFGCDLGQEQREQQILFLGEGDNYVLTEQIAPNWFWYEQHW